VHYQVCCEAKDRLASGNFVFRTPKNDGIRRIPGELPLPEGHGNEAAFNPMAGHSHARDEKPGDEFQPRNVRAMPSGLIEWFVGKLFPLLQDMKNGCPITVLRTVAPGFRDTQRESPRKSTAYFPIHGGSFQYFPCWPRKPTVNYELLMPPL